MTSGRGFLLLCCAGLAACASAPPPQDFAVEDSAPAMRIRDGMEKLGASPTRRECFARRVASALDERRGAEAAAIVERATSREEMREGVLSASGPVRKAFIGANLGCSL